MSHTDLLKIACKRCINSARLRGAVDLALFAASGLLAVQVHGAKGSDSAERQSAGMLRFTLTDVSSDRGFIRLQVSASEGAFKGEAPTTAALVLPAQIGQTSVQIDRFPPGEYAIRVMHDEDSDGELKTNLLGMPTEPWGMSNNASGTFGPPTWQDAKFSVPSDTTQTIQLHK